MSSQFGIQIEHGTRKCLYLLYPVTQSSILCIEEIPACREAISVSVYRELINTHVSSNGKQPKECELKSCSCLTEQVH